MKGVIIFILTEIILVCLSMHKSKHFLVETVDKNLDNLKNNRDQNRENRDRNGENRDYRQKFGKHRHERRRRNKVEIK